MKLFEHQKAALAKLHNGSILWGGVGSGKSITGIAYYFSVECHDMSVPKDLYIITTARKRDTHEWDGELARFGLSTNPDICSGGVKVTVDSWNNIQKYRDIRDSFFLFDEQRVVGYGAWTKSFLKITSHNRWILLSATPGDCWMDYLPVFIANGYYTSKRDFQMQHVLYNRYNTRYPQIQGYMNEKILRKHRDDILVGMTYDKQTVANHETVICHYDRNKYDVLMKTRWNPFSDEPVRDAGELCLLLRRIVNSDSDRLNKLDDILRKHGKAIVFYNYDYELELMKDNLSDIRWPYAEWNGHRHEPIPSESRWAYLVQYAAGSEGWNCIEANTVIFYSQSYSYKAMIQAAGRIDRLNTGYHDLYYYHLTTTSKIDMAITRALKNKKNFNESAFAGTFSKR